MTSEPVNQRTDDDEKTLTLRIFGSHEAADLAAAKLEAHGIKCWVDADDCSGMYPSLTTAVGVRLKVRTADAGDAADLLDAQATTAEIDQIEIEALSGALPKTTPLKKLAWGQIAIGFLFGLLVCCFFQKTGPGNNTYYSYTADGKCYEAAVYRHGQIVTLYKDRNLDGKWDVWIHYELGHVAKVEYDNNFDGKVDEVVIYSNSLLATAELDTDFNGVPDLFCTYTNGMIQQIEVRPNGSKITITREIYKHGLLTEIWRGGDSNGFFNVVEKYDSFINPIGTKNPEGFRLLSPASK